CRDLEIPNPKAQNPKPKLQDANPNGRLESGPVWDLGFGIWDLGFGICYRVLSRPLVSVATIVRLPNGVSALSVVVSVWRSSLRLMISRVLVENFLWPVSVARVLSVTSATPSHLVLLFTSTSGDGWFLVSLPPKE